MIRFCLIVAALFCAAAAHAQTYKCRNAAGKVTYSGQPCRDIGLRDAGEVADKVNVTPAVRPNYPAWNKPQEDAPAAQEKKAEPPKAPERRCFTVKNAKGGSSTFCNDAPEDESKK